MFSKTLMPPLHEDVVGDPPSAVLNQPPAISFPSYTVRAKTPQPIPDPSGDQPAVAGSQAAM